MMPWQHTTGNMSAADKATWHEHTCCFLVCLTGILGCEAARPATGLDDRTMRAGLGLFVAGPGLRRRLEDVPPASSSPAEAAV